MLFEEVNSMWTEDRLTQAEAARLPGVCERTFRRYLARLRECDALLLLSMSTGLEGVADARPGSEKF